MAEPLRESQRFFADKAEAYRQSPTHGNAAELDRMISWLMEGNGKDEGKRYAVPKDTVEDNTQAWIGDHCMAAHLVPGVLLSNRKIVAAEPQLYDIASTILGEFGIANTAGMIGRSVF